MTRLRWPNAIAGAACCAVSPLNFLDGWALVGVLVLFAGIVNILIALRPETDDAP